ncbi:MAG: ATP-binding protein, partial [Comamonadaceae bacterium]
QHLLQSLGAVRIRSDVERKRLAGLAPLADSRAAGLDLYGADATRRTYGRLFELAGLALAAGYPVVLDAAFLRRAERMQAQALASGMGVPYAAVPCEAPAQVLRERLAARRGDASEADAGVLEQLTHAAEPLGGDEPVWRG